MSKLASTSTIYHADGSIETRQTYFPADAPAAPYDQENDSQEAPAEDHTVEFVYDSAVRVVVNPKITRGAYRYDRIGRAYAYNPLLSGVELTRDGNESNQFKHYSLNEIRPV